MLGWLEDTSNRVLGFNPCVLLHDLRLRMRTSSIFWLMLAFVLLCAAAVALPFISWIASHAAHGTMPDSFDEIGRNAFVALAYTLLTLILLALPAWAAAGIAGERERHTLAVLRSTMLSASDVAMGKFAATISCATILLAVSLPFAAWCVMLGSVSPAEVAVVYFILLAFCVCVAGVGTWMSALCRSTIAAVISTYLILIAVFGGILLIPVLRNAIPGVTGQIFHDLTVALSCTVPAAITAWTVAVIVRWMIARAGMAQGQRAQALLGIIIFAASIWILALEAERAGLLTAWDPRKLSEINPYLGLIEVIDSDRSFWDIIWVSGAVTSAGCMLAVRALRLREFHPVYVEDISVSAWERVRSLRPTPSETYAAQVIEAHTGNACVQSDPARGGAA